VYLVIFSAIIDISFHLDKASEELKASAHTTFQNIAFAYAVLSDPTRRKRYDATGSTAESIVDSDGFSWTDFYREQFTDVISSEAIEKFAKKYKGSDEEKDDLLIAYKESKGNMDKVFGKVMLSDPQDDDERFRTIIDEAIASGDLEGYKAYVNETRASKERRIKNADKEGDEAMAYAEELGVAEKLFGKKGKSKNNGEDALKALIQKKQKDRNSFLENLEAKYAPQPKLKAKAKKGKKRASPDEEEEEEVEPSEEAFQAAAARLKNAKADTGNTRKSKRAKN
jgi:DnaJ homolog subfamily C member 9